MIANHKGMLLGMAIGGLIDFYFEFFPLFTGMIMLISALTFHFYGRLANQTTSFIKNGVSLKNFVTVIVTLLICFLFALYFEL
ncbi:MULTISPECIES: hypothetical protein [unclassified Pseudoalteromonas]|uniref:hypothetical protein n=1 Tax=unclassified Pseudoalteromonas TaxID=194690 RepID=UPI0005A6BF09|nr:MULTISPECIES: hypothetical protein [unclassified Pseudoalteromonas]